jgi:hypothetical protein
MPYQPLQLHRKLEEPFMNDNKKGGVPAPTQRIRHHTRHSDKTTAHSGRPGQASNANRGWGTTRAGLSASSGWKKGVKHGHELLVQHVALLVL